jgi:hypothetical protein
VTKPLEDLDVKSQAKIAELVAAAPRLNTRQRERLEMLFRGSATDEAGAT